ncbi:recombinase family protein [Rhizobium gallicum]|uniref:recombinase family protein n=1 Tax=Rhizobium gallicum TaxID=56730 RepID=UPI003B8A9959
MIRSLGTRGGSGASLLRPGIQALIADFTRSRFDLILAEAMDRLSRDQEDIAGLFKRMSYSNVKIFTLSEGEVSHLHVGLTCSAWRRSPQQAKPELRSFYCVGRTAKYLCAQ